MRKTQLGEFEEIVLLIVATLGDTAYGVAINEAIEAQTGRDLSISAIHGRCLASAFRVPDRSRVVDLCPGWFVRAVACASHNRQHCRQGRR